MLSTSVFSSKRWFSNWLLASISRVKKAKKSFVHHQLATGTNHQRLGLPKKLQFFPSTGYGYAGKGNKILSPNSMIHSFLCKSWTNGSIIHHPPSGSGIPCPPSWWKSCTITHLFFQNHKPPIVLHQIPAPTRGIYRVVGCPPNLPPTNNIRLRGPLKPHKSPLLQDSHLLGCEL